MTYFTSVLMVMATHRLISFFHPTFLPQSLHECFLSLKVCTVKMYRLIYPPLFILTILEPHNIWKYSIFILIIEISYLIFPIIIDLLIENYRRKRKR